MSGKLLTFRSSGLMYTLLFPSPSGPTDSITTPPHFILLPHCNFDGDNFIPLFLHTENTRLIRSSSCSNFLPPPRTSSAFFQMPSVLRISSSVLMSNNSGLTLSPWGSTQYLYFPQGRMMLNKCLDSSAWGSWENPEEKLTAAKYLSWGFKRFRIPHDPSKGCSGLLSLRLMPRKSATSLDFSLVSGFQGKIHLRDFQ